MKVTNIGIIKSILVPEGWLNSRKIIAQFGNSYLLRYSPPDLAQVRLCFFFRGKLVEVASGQDFCNLLQQSPHKLQPGEIEAISEVLRDEALPELFCLEQANTVDLNSKRVLVIQGKFVEFNFNAYCIFIDAGEGGSCVQEIYFTAPLQHWHRYIGQVLTSLDSIEWL